MGKAMLVSGHSWKNAETVDNLVGVQSVLCSQIQAGTRTSESLQQGCRDKSDLISFSKPKKGASASTRWKPSVWRVFNLAEDYVGMADRDVRRDRKDSTCLTAST